MSTASERESALRRALLSAAAQIEPVPGGLERIQARLRRPRPLPVAWLEAAWNVLTMRTPDVIEAVRRRLAMVLGLVWERFGPRSVPGPGLGSRLRWLRPLVAMSVAVFVIGSGIYIGLASPATIFQAGVSSGAGGDNGSHPGGSTHGGHGAPYGKGVLPPYPRTPNSSGSSPACKKSTPRYAAGPSQSAPGQSTTPATSPSLSTSPSPSPSQSVSPSSTPASSGNVASPGAGLINVNAGNAVSGTGATKNLRSGKPSNTGSVRATPSAGPASPAAGGQNLPSSNSPQYNPCQTTKSHRKHHKKTSPASTAGLTSVQLTQTQPGEAVVAKLD